MTRKQITKVLPLYGARVFLLDSNTDGIIGPLLAHEADAELDRLHPTYAPYDTCTTSDVKASAHVIYSFEAEHPEAGTDPESVVINGKVYVEEQPVSIRSFPARTPDEDEL